jgi:putative hydrolase of the HAD superfamily
MLDMGGVLTEDQRQDKVEEMRAVLGPRAAREAFSSAYWRHRLDYDRGLLDGLAYWGRIAAELGVALTSDEIGRAVRADLQSWFNMRPAMRDFVVGIKGKVRRLVLLSNIHADGARYLRDGEARPWAALFDELVLSCEHKLLKPEAEIYELALGAAGARPAETLFVDDNPDNVEGALRAGLSSFRFEGEEDFAARMARDYELAL